MWTGGERKTKNIKQDVLRLCQKRSGSVYHVPFLEGLQLFLWKCDKSKNVHVIALQAYWCSNIKTAHSYIASKGAMKRRFCISVAAVLISHFTLPKAFDDWTLDWCPLHSSYRKNYFLKNTTPIISFSVSNIRNEMSNHRANGFSIAVKVFMVWKICSLVFTHACLVCLPFSIYRVTKTIFCQKKCLHLLQFQSYTKILEYGKVWELYILFKLIKIFWKFLKISCSFKK